MFSKFRNLIFKIDPEIAHNLAIKSLKFNFVSNIFDENKNDPMFQTTLFGKKLDNPIGIAAGFDKDAEVYNPLFKLGFGFVEVGTVTPLGQYGNPKPRVFRLVEDHALINRLGFNNSGAKDINLRIRSKIPKGLLGINIGPNRDTKDRLNDYLIGLRTFHDIADYITINISSPNTPGLRDLQLRGKIEALVKALQKKQEELDNLNKKPIFFKISPDLNDEQLRDIALMALANNIEGLIISNTTIERPKNLLSKNKNEIGGLSGKPLFVQSTLSLKKMFSLTNGQIPLIGVGGVSNGNECYEKIKSGANLIQLYTALIFQGPKIVTKIKNELVDLMKTDGFKNIKEVVGKDT